MKKLVAVFSISTLFASLVACNSSKISEYSVIVSLGSEPGTLDPAIALTVDTRAYLSHLFEGLTYIDSDGTVRPAVAKEWTHNGDFTEWRFFIREDPLWSDGKLVSAEDFKYAWLRVLDPQTASGWASFFQYIDNATLYNEGNCSEDAVGISIEKGNELVVLLNTPCSFFDSMVSLQPYYPVRQDIITKYGAGWTRDPESFIINGAFMLSSWRHNESITLVKNIKFFNSEFVNIEKIVFILSTNSSVIMSAFETNEIDFAANTLTSSEMRQISSVSLADYAHTKFLALNLKREKLQNIDVRKAINLLLDRTEIAKQIGDTTLPLLTFIPEGFLNFDEDLDYTKDSHSTVFFDSVANIAEAINLLTNVGYSSNNPLLLDYLTNNSSLNTALAEIIKEQLELSGLIKVNINVFESAVFNSKRVDRDFDIVAASWAAEYPDITSYLYGFKSSDFNNYASFNSVEFDLVFDSIFKAQNASEKMKTTHEAETIIMKSYAIAPLYYEKTPFVTKGTIDGYWYDLTGCLTFKYAQLNK